MRQKTVSCTRSTTCCSTRRMLIRHAAIGIEAPSRSFEMVNCLWCTTACVPSHGCCLAAAAHAVAVQHLRGSTECHRHRGEQPPDPPHPCQCYIHQQCDTLQTICQVKDRAAVQLRAEHCTAGATSFCGCMIADLILGLEAAGPAGPWLPGCRLY